MKLYTHPISTNARRAHMTLLELGIPFETVFVDLAKGEQRQPDYLALNPHGRVPTLVDGEFVLAESLAIMTYACEKTPGQKLLPSEPRARAQVNEWLYWAACHWGPAGAQLTFENFLKKMFGMGDPDEYAVKRHTTLFAGCAKVLDDTLATRSFVAGPELTLADLAIAPVLMSMATAKLPVEGLANIERWFASIRERDSWKATEPKL